MASSHPSPSVLIPALRTVGNIVTGDDLQTQVTWFSTCTLMDFTASTKMFLQFWVIFTLMCMCPVWLPRLRRLEVSSFPFYFCKAHFFFSAVGLLQKLKLKNIPLSYDVWPRCTWACRCLWNGMKWRLGLLGSHACYRCVSYALLLTLKVGMKHNWFTMWLYWGPVTCWTSFQVSRQSNTWLGM